MNSGEGLSDKPLTKSEWVEKIANVLYYLKNCLCPITGQGKECFKK